MLIKLIDSNKLELDIDIESHVLPEYINYKNYIYKHAGHFEYKQIEIIPVTEKVYHCVRLLNHQRETVAELKIVDYVEIIIHCGKAYKIETSRMLYMETTVLIIG